MTILEAPPSVALDESAHEFITAFMTHVATVSGYGTNRIVTIARIKTLLLSALACGDGTSSPAWISLHRAIAELVDRSSVATDATGAHQYLQSFVQENGDLAAR